MLTKFPIKEVLPRVSCLCFMQEVAGNHGVALWGRTEEGFATDPVMVAMQLIFAATRIQIEMFDAPKW